jgi:tRNA (cytidine32/uridine32-2'-O)-methyltransferase
MTAPIDIRTPTRIRIVLVETSHPGNIGAVARAMKNMGLHELFLVRPKSFPHTEASARASGATDLLTSARVVDSVGEAIADCALVIGTTSRDREHNFRVWDVREAAERAQHIAHTGCVAFLFGNERAGLSNEELAQANALLRIPTSDEYPSLNLAMAVQIVSYEIWRARSAERAMTAGRAMVSSSVPLATAEQTERFYAHLQTVMDEVGFRDRTQVGTSLMTRLRRLFGRTDMDQNEVNILRGFLTAVQQKRRTAGQRAANPSVSGDDDPLSSQVDRS